MFRDFWDFYVLAGLINFRTIGHTNLVTLLVRKISIHMVKKLEYTWLKNRVRNYEFKLQKDNASEFKNFVTS